jgi:hypothetical protein
VNADLILNSFSVIGQNSKIIFEILAFVFWGTLLVFAFLKKITKQNYTDPELIALALGGWPLPAFIFSVSIILLRAVIPGNILFLTAIIFLIVSAGVAFRAVWKDVSLNLLSIPLMFFVFVFIRLGFSANIILPPYFDSAEHYRIINFLLQTPISPKFVWPTASYYHIGYHLIITALVSLTHANIGQVMLLFGQIVLAAIPFPVYFFAHRAVNSHAAALFAVALAAFGWFMPSHSVNWGKYPALLSLLLIQFTLGMAVIKNRWLIMLSLLASVLIHSRSIILIGVFGIAWMLSQLLRDKRKLFFALGAAMLGMAALLIDQNQALGPVVEPYRIWVTLLVGLLSASVARSFPRLILFSTLAMLGMLAMSFIPISNSYTLLDRPLVEMILFLPLAFLGGVGAARLPKAAILLFAVIIIFNAFTHYNFSPSNCCQLVARDDRTALDWIDRQLPDDARVAIAGADLNIDAFSAPMQGTGTDAGIWIMPLSGREVTSLPYFTDFGSQEIYQSLCQQQVTHIYVGSRPQSFITDFFQARPAWYEVIFHLPGTQIVRVRGCRVE